MAKAESISVAIPHVSEIADLPILVYEINQSIDRIRNAGSEGIAEILREISQAVVIDPNLRQRIRQSTMEILRTLASEASLPPVQRDLRIVNSHLLIIPALVDSSLDILNYFYMHLAELERFFGIDE